MSALFYTAKRWGYSASVWRIPPRRFSQTGTARAGEATEPIPGEE
jgi:hypothetical protein